jgi:hypothetical protein
MCPKLVRAITFLSFEIGKWYLVCGCMTIRQCVVYCNDLHGTLTSSSNNCFFIKGTDLWATKYLTQKKPRKNCFRYLKLMCPLNAVIYTTISYTLWVEWYYLKNNYLTLRSKSHEGHYGTRHTALWSCTHIPNIIDLSWKTKMLWPGQERHKF